ncbi:MAG: FAD-binding oxidoreductase [Proteobacteria bacterium]|nr:FAD-binding oxidoreductase [Pseudomonadota bacterium]
MLRWGKRSAEGPRLAGWGRLSVPGRERRSEALEPLTEGAVLTRGLGRSYGDASLPPPSVLEVAATPLADRILAFDETTGALRAEAGLSLAAINQLFLPRRWCSPTLPGTQFITLGGMVAADVHDKSHHCAGSFGRHVKGLRLRVGDGRIVDCSASAHEDLFWATVGGMGLTGHILEVELTLQRIPSPWIWQESERVPNIDAYLDALESAARTWPYTVGWIDCLSRGRKLGRGVLLCGRWAEAHEAPPFAPAAKHKLTVPFELPSWALSGPTVRAFNEVYYGSHQPRQRQRIVHPESFFHPLDAILHWNRIYGARGFTQYQCLLPRSAGRGAARRFLELLTARGGASFLCVIKDCGEQGQGLLSFPMPGVSIALDLAVRDDTQQLVDALNELVIAEGGRIYLAKDAFTRAEHFRAMEPRLEGWQAVRRRWDPEGRLRSALSVRLFGDPP